MQFNECITPQITMEMQLSCGFHQAAESKSTRQKNKENNDNNRERDLI